MNQLNKLIEQYTNLHDLSYAKSLYKKETEKYADRKDTKVTEYWDELDKTADFACWWSNKLKSEFKRLRESISFCGKEQRKFLDEVENSGIIDQYANVKDDGCDQFNIIIGGETTIHDLDFYPAIKDIKKVIKGE